jgi:hypothetical protein
MPPSILIDQASMSGRLHHKAGSEIMRKSILIMALCLLAISALSCGSLQPSADEMRKLIAAQLPVGSSKSQVATFLESKSIHHSDINEQFEYDEEGQYTKFRIMTASIDRGSSKVFMRFYFDESDRLTRYKVQNTYQSF